MKKLFALFLTLILAVSFLTVTSFATEVEDTVNSATETPEEVVGVELPEEAPEIATGEENSGESAEKFYSAWLDKLTDSTLWINLGVTLSGVLAAILFIRSNFGGMSGLITSLITMVKGNATKDEIKEFVTGAMKGATEAYKTESEAMRKKFEEQLDVNNKLLSVITIFVTNANVNPHARTEMLNIITSVKPVLESVEKTVEVANRAIAEAKAAEPVVPTPALDEIITEVESPEIPYMELG